MYICFKGVVMNLKEHTMITAEEEALEVAHAISKAIRFGTEKGLPGTDRNNAEDIGVEFCQLVAMLELMEDRGIKIPYVNFNRQADVPFIQVNRDLVDKKKAKFNEFLEYSKARGTYQEEITS